MKYASVCSGVEAASLAWEYLGWKPVWFSEIEPFPCEVLKQRFPNVPNLGDMTKIKVENLDNGDQKYTNGMGTDVIVPGGVDLLVGGTPCQSFSVAGKREGLEGASGLARTFVELLGAMQPRWFVWENVPGCLSSKSNAGIYDFNFLLAAFAECGYSCGWRILDSQYVRVDGFPRAVPQRRRRVFVVGHLGKQWEYPAKVLFEQQSLLGNTPPCRIKGKGFTADVERSIGTASTDVSGLDCYNQCLSGDVSMTVTSKRSDPHHVPCAVQSVKSTFWNGKDVAETLTAKGADDSMPDKNRLPCVITPSGADICDTLDASYYKGVGNRNGNERTRICLNDQGGSVMAVEENGNAGTLRANAHGNEQIVCYENHANDSRVKEMGESCQTLNCRMGTGGGNLPLVQECYGFDQYNMDKTGRQSVAIAFEPGMAKRDGSDNRFTEEFSGTLRSNAGDNQTAVAIAENVIGRKVETGGNGVGAQEELAYTQNATGVMGVCNSTVRRLIPVECERLMGFPDNHTRIVWNGKSPEECPDAPRYKACGNSFCVNVVRWIGIQIDRVERMIKNEND